MNTKRKYISIGVLFSVILFGASFGLIKMAESNASARFLKIEDSIRSKKFENVFGKIQEVEPLFKNGWRERKMGETEEGEGFIIVKSETYSGKMHIWWSVNSGNYHLTRIENEKSEELYQE